MNAPAISTKRADPDGSLGREAYFCFWAVRELGIPQKELAERFSLSEPTIAYAVKKGRRLAEERGYRLRER